MYSPEIAEEHIRRLYRLARIREIPMTQLVDEIIAEYLSQKEQELASYNPLLHDRQTTKLRRAA